MSHYIPVMFTICDEAAIPQAQDCWHDAQPLMSAAMAGTTGFPLHTATATNWSQVEAIRRIKNRESLPGLEFTDREVTVVSGDALQAARSSLSAVIEAYEPEINAASVAVDVKASALAIDCDVDDGLAEFLTALVASLDEAIRNGRAFVFVQPQP